MTQQKLESEAAKEEILLSLWAHPGSAGDGFVTLTNALSNFKKHSESALSSAIEELVRDGSLSLLEKKLPKSGESMYCATPRLVESRIQLLREKKLMQLSLLKQRDFDIADLLIAIGMDVVFSNSRTPAGYARAPEITALPVVLLFLDKFTEREIRDGLAHLQAKNFVNTCKVKYFGSEVDAFSVTPLGRATFERSISGRLGLSSDISILDQPKLGDCISIFFAWQSEFKPSRNQIMKALEDVSEIANSTWSPVRQIRITQATEAGDGAVNITVELLEKIRSAEIFVGDLTPVIAFGGRLYPNSNVLIESGYALAGKEANQVILLEAKRNISEITGDGSEHANFPFDISVVRRIPFEFPKDLKDKLLVEFKEVLTRRGKLLT